MRHRIKFGKVGSFNPEEIKPQTIESKQEVLSEEVEEIFEEDTEYRNDDETMAAMEFYDSLDEMV